MKIWNQNETLCCSFFVICKNPWPGEKWSSWDATFCLWVEQQDGMGWEGCGPILEIIQCGHISSVVKNKVPAWPTTETHPWVCYIVIPAWMLWNLKTHMNMECHNWRTPLWYGDHRQWVGSVCDKQHTWWDDHKNLSDWPPQYTYTTTYTPHLRQVCSFNTVL